MFKLLDKLVGVDGRGEWRAHWLVVSASIVGIMISQVTPLALFSGYLLLILATYPKFDERETDTQQGFAVATS